MTDPIKQWRDKRQAQRDAEETDARDRYNERLKERARLAYLTAGGDETSFKEEWPTLKKELLRGETIQTLRGNK
jgi:hypothetical protein